MRCYFYGSPILSLLQFLVLDLCENYKPIHTYINIIKVHLVRFDFPPMFGWILWWKSLKKCGTVPLSDVRPVCWPTIYNQSKREMLDCIDLEAFSNILKRKSLKTFRDNVPASNLLSVCPINCRWYVLCLPWWLVSCPHEAFITYILIHADLILCM